MKKMYKVTEIRKERNGRKGLYEYTFKSLAEAIERFEEDQCKIYYDIYLTEVQINFETEKYVYQEASIIDEWHNK